MKTVIQKGKGAEGTECDELRCPAATLFWITRCQQFGNVDCFCKSSINVPSPLIYNWRNSKTYRILHRRRKRQQEPNKLRAESLVSNLFTAWLVQVTYPHASVSSSLKWGIIMLPHRVFVRIKRDNTYTVCSTELSSSKPLSKQLFLLPICLRQSQMSKQMLTQGVLWVSTLRTCMHWLLNITSNPHNTLELDDISNILQIEKNQKIWGP